MREIGNRVLALFGGYPGAGKSTVATGLKSHLKRALLVTSNDVRSQLGLKNLLSDYQREILLREILARLDRSSNDGADWIIVDTNLIDRTWRTEFARWGSEHGVRRVYFHLTAQLEDIKERVERKFGQRPMYEHE